jgi:hypothetical protein
MSLDACTCTHAEDGFDPHCPLHDDGTIVNWIEVEAMVDYGAEWTPAACNRLADALKKNGFRP